MRAVLPALLLSLIAAACREEPSTAPEPEAGAAAAPAGRARPAPDAREPGAPAADEPEAPAADAPEAPAADAPEAPAADAVGDSPFRPGSIAPDAEVEALRRLRSSAVELMTRPEIADANVKVQHLLVSFQGAGVPGVSRTKDQAEALAAELYVRVLQGEDFDALVREHTDDSHPGIYPMSKGSRMVQGFLDVGFRLQVGEVGVSPFEARKSPYGWHLIERLE